MKKILFVVLLLITSPVFADLYVIYNKDTKAVYSVSEKNDTVVPDGYKLKMLEGDYDFAKHPSEYDFKSNKFVISVKRLEEKEKRNKRKQEIQKIKEKALMMAKEQLTDEGEIFTEITPEDLKGGL